MPSMRKSIFFWLAFVSAIILAIYLSARLVMLATGSRGIADIKTISVSSAHGKIDRAAIATAAGIRARTPTYGVKLDDALNRIMAIPDVQSAGVRRTASGNLAIRVELRTVVAYWTDGTHFYPLARDGAVINRPLTDMPHDAVLFRGLLPTDVATVVKDVKQFPKILANVSYLEWTSARRWNLVMRGGMIVMLPENDIAAALANLTTLDAKGNILGRDIRILDLRDDARTFVRVD